MAIVRQHDKRSGITYVYESTSYWDKEKQQSRSHRKLIGRLDPETGKVVPTKGWGKRRGQSKDKAPAPRKRGPVPSIHTKRLFYGATYLFDQIGEATGVAADLKTCFPILTARFSPLPIILSLRTGTLYSGLPDGQSSISIHTVRISHLSGAPRFSSPSLRKQRCVSSVCRAGGVQRRSAGLMTRHLFPAAPSF